MIKKNKKTIQSGFDEISAKYDFFNNILTFGIHKKIKKKLAKKVACSTKNEKNALLLDLCSGTGDIAFYLQKYIGEDQKVIGVDFSEKMIDIARKKHNKIQFICQDVFSLDYARNTVSAITIGYGLRNLVNLDQGLEKIYTMLKKGGIFCSLDMGKINLPILKQIFHLFFFYLVPKIGGILVPKSKMFEYFPISTKDYPDALAMKKKLEKVGFRKISYQNSLLGACVVHFAQK